MPREYERGQLQNGMVRENDVFLQLFTYQLLRMGMAIDACVQGNDAG